MILSEGDRHAVRTAARAPELTETFHERHLPADQTGQGLPSHLTEVTTVLTAQLHVRIAVIGPAGLGGEREWHIGQHRLSPDRLSMQRREIRSTKWSNAPNPLAIQSPVATDPYPKRRLRGCDQKRRDPYVTSWPGVCGNSERRLLAHHLFGQVDSISRGSPYFGRLLRSADRPATRLRTVSA